MALSFNTETRLTQHYANAEKDICDQIGSAFAAIMRAAESEHGVQINELRVTMLDDRTGERWAQAICTIMR
ncbi:MAG: hypothetical protein ACREYD_05550 [Casimicrobiaceae bacterium]